jgi:hypothetical protein
VVLAGTVAADPVDRRMPSGYAFGADGETIFVARGKRTCSLRRVPPRRPRSRWRKIVEQAL